MGLGLLRLLLGVPLGLFSAAGFGYLLAMALAARTATAVFSGPVPGKLIVWQHATTPVAPSVRDQSLDPDGHGMKVFAQRL